MEKINPIVNKLKKNIANFITSLRIIFSVCLLFFPVFSVLFYTFYVLAGLTDMIDGFVARKTKTESEFGSKLDTLSDLIFTTVCLIKIIPKLKLDVWGFIWIAIIAFIKIVNIFLCYLFNKKFISIHSIANKITGFVLFIFPLTISILPINYSLIFLSSIATFSAIQEGYLVSISKRIIYNKTKKYG